MTKLEELESKLSDICEEHFTDCTKCPVKARCDEYTSPYVSESTEEVKIKVLEKMFEDSQN